MKKTFNSAFILILLFCGNISCGDRKQDSTNFSSEDRKNGNFEPVYEYSPWDSVDVKLFPPRIRGREGVSLSRMEKTEQGISWTTSLGKLTMTTLSSESDGKMEVRMSIINNGKKDELVSIRYPEVFYLFKSDTTLRVLDPTFGGVLEPRKPYPSVDTWYPGYASFCATMVTGKDKALGIALRNTRQRSAHIIHLPARPAGQMSIELESVLVPAGESVDLPEGYIATGNEWSEVLKPYRDWLLATFPPKMNPPAWYESGDFMKVWQAHCMVPGYPPPAVPGIWVFSPAFRKRTMEDVHKDIDLGFESAAKQGSKPLFYQFGWWKLMETFQGLHMFDGVCGDYTEGHELAKEAVKYIHSKGGKTFLYTNFISAGEESKVFREQPGLFARRADGSAIRNASYPMYMFCPGAPGIREYWDKVLTYILKDMDADGVFLDQLGGATPSLICYDPTHNHAYPDIYGEDYMGLVEYVSRRTKEIKPDAIVCCELIDDVMSMWIDLVQGFGYSRPTKMEFTSALQAANTPPNEYMVFLKYLNPHAIMFPDRPDNVALGAPGYPGDTIYTKHKAIFKSGLKPCHTDPVGAMAYLYGPVNGEAILVTKAWADIKNVKVTIPETLIPAVGGTDIATSNGSGSVIVQAGTNARFYKLQTNK